MSEREAPPSDDDVPEADAVEQARAIVQQDEADPHEAIDVPLEADVADVAEQRAPLPEDQDEHEHSSSADTRAPEL
jgi:hypothetical protein